MNEHDLMSRRKALSLGLAAAFGLAAPAAVLTVSEVEAQTAVAWNGVKSGAQVAMSGVRRGAQVAMNGVRRGARVPRLRPRRRRRSSSPAAPQQSRLRLEASRRVPPAWREFIPPTV